MQVDDIVFVLDTRIGEFFALDPEDSRQWVRAVDPVAVGAIDGAEAILGDARDRGWLRLAAEPAGPVDLMPRVPGYLARRFLAADAFACLARAYLSVRWLPFWRSYAWAAASAPAPAAEPATLDRGLGAFSRAEHAVASRMGVDDCLPRSLALYAFLRRRGLPVRHRIGVRRYPFGSHAWVEHEGEPLLDSPERIAAYTPIATIDGAGGR